MKLTKRIALVGLMIAGFAFQASAQQVFRATSTSTIPFLQYLPSDYNSNSNKYPIVIFLHGIGERGPNTTDKNIQDDYIQNVAKLGPPMYAKNGTQFPFILISPQLKNNYGSWPTWYVMEVINYVKNYLRVDEKKIYITGLSLGGYGAWTMIEDYPKLFAAAAPVCGGWNRPSKALGIAKENLPVWAFHGTKDNVVKYTVTTNMVNAINGSTPKPSPLAKTTLYSDIYHDAWKYAYRTDHTKHNPNLYEWIRNYTNTYNAGNRIPTANANADQTKYLSSATKTVIYGSASDDGSIVSYRWTKIGGPTATLSGVDTKSLTVSSLKVGTYYFRLTVKDNSGNTDSDYVRVIVK
jgi:dienelactone hydrolase